MFEIRFYRCAERFLDNCSQAERTDVIVAAERLGLDPYIDGETKFVFPAPPVMLRMYVDGTYWIVYHYDNANQVHIYNVGRAGTDTPSFRCPDS